MQGALRVISPDLKRLGRESDESPPSNSTVQKEYSYIPTPPAPYCRGQRQFYVSFNTFNTV